MAQSFHPGITVCGIMEVLKTYGHLTKPVRASGAIKTRAEDVGKLARNLSVPICIDVCSTFVGATGRLLLQWHKP